MDKVIIKLNDKEVEISLNSSLEELLQSRNFGSEHLIIEFNGRLLNTRKEAQNITLVNGDIINIFSLVAGG